MILHSQDQTHLFTVRLWREPLGEGQVEVRFQVQHVLSGESRVFRDDAQLVAYLRAKIEEAEQEQS